MRLLLHTEIDGALRFGHGCVTGAGGRERPSLRTRRLPQVPMSHFISQKVSIKSFCKSQFLHKSVNVCFILVMINDKLTDLCGN